MPLFKGFMARKAVLNSKYAIVVVALPFAIISVTENCFAQTWDKSSQATFIYQREVPTRPAQIDGVPAAPSEVILSGPDSPFDAVMHLREPLSDLEAGAINGQAPTGLDILLPGAPSSGTDPQAIAGYAGSLSGAVTSAVTGTLAQTVTQTTGILTDATTAITGAISKLPTPGSY